MVFKLVYSFVVNCGYLFSSSMKSSNKIKIFFNYSKINFKYLIDSLFKFKSESFLGFKFYSFNYLNLKILFTDTFVRQEYFFLSKNKKPLIVDCGSNIGIGPIFFKYLYPKSEIHCFEPDPVTFKLLNKNIKKNNLNNIHLNNVAVSNKKEDLFFYIDKKNPGSLFMSTLYERNPKDKVKVKAISLSNYFETVLKSRTIDFMKIDIEGAELNLFKDLYKKDKLKQINSGIIEYHHKIDNSNSELSQFLSILEKSGFEYQIDTINVPISKKNNFQNIMIFFYKN